MPRCSLSNPLVWLFLIAANFLALRIVEQSGSVSFQQLMLRGTMVGLFSCVCVASCRHRTSPLNLALLIVSLATIGSIPATWSPLSFSMPIIDDFTRIWFLGLVIQMVAVSVSYFMLQRIPLAFDEWIDEEAHEENEQETPAKQPWQISTRGLISLTSAIAILLSSTLWLNTDSQSAFLAVMVFGGSGILTAINFWIADRHDIQTACTGTLMIVLGISGLLKLTQLDLQQWLTVVFFTIAVQATAMLAAIVHRFATSTNSVDQNRSPSLDPAP